MPSVKFNICHFKPDHPRWQILDAYLEVEKTIKWGLEANNYDCSHRLNAIDPTRKNIIFGWIPMLQMGLFSQIPRDSILVNLEQLSERKAYDPTLRSIFETHTIWDYSESNAQYWKLQNLYDNFVYSPISYAPILTSMNRQSDFDVDITFIGSVGQRRFDTLSKIASHPSRPSLLICQNTWGITRDDLLSRTQMCLNISDHNPKLRIFEIVRVSYYLANHLPVLCESVTDIIPESDIKAGMLYSDGVNFADKCADLLHNRAILTDIGNIGFELFSKRDIKNNVISWLEKSD